VQGIKGKTVISSLSGCAEISVGADGGTRYKCKRMMVR